MISYSFPNVPLAYQLLISFTMENSQSSSTGNSTLSKALWRSKRHVHSRAFLDASQLGCKDDVRTPNMQMRKTSLYKAIFHSRQNQDLWNLYYMV